MRHPARFLLALAVLCSSTGIGAAQQIPVFKSGVDLVNLGVTVTDRKGNLVTDLTADDFDVFEDGKKQALSFFAPGDPTAAGANAPEMHLGLLLDISESMGED